MKYFLRRRVNILTLWKFPPINKNRAICARMCMTMALHFFFLKVLNHFFRFLRVDNTFQTLMSRMIRGDFFLLSLIHTDTDRHTQTRVCFVDRSECHKRKALSQCRCRHRWRYVWCMVIFIISSIQVWTECRVLSSLRMNVSSIDVTSIQRLDSA